MRRSLGACTEHGLFAPDTVVATIFEINAQFFGGAMSKINRDKCLEIWGFKTYLEINA